MDVLKTMEDEFNDKLAEKDLRIAELEAIIDTMLNGGEPA